MGDVTDEAESALAIGKRARLDQDGAGYAQQPV